jgi:hypothetical protein
MAVYYVDNKKYINKMCGEEAEFWVLKNPVVKAWILATML